MPYKIPTKLDTAAIRENIHGFDADSLRHLILRLCDDIDQLRGQGGMGTSREQPQPKGKSVGDCMFENIVGTSVGDPCKTRPDI